MTAKPSLETTTTPTWALVLAFAAVYLSWGTTYWAIRLGVADEHLPPALFGGTRVMLAGCILFASQWLRGVSLRIPPRDLFWIVVSGLLLFVGGNGLITVAETMVKSAMASILIATTPLWLALLEILWPQGERLLVRGWIGLTIGLCGVLLLNKPAEFTQSWGPLLVLGSALCWALGSLLLRYHRPKGPHLVAAAVQMMVGGGGLALVGLTLGETHHLPAVITPRAAGAFLYLLIVGSLVGFVAFNWLLGHVSATLVGTYAYVNPVIAVLVGGFLGNEEISWRMLLGMVVILSAVALVRGASKRRQTDTERLRPPASGLTGYWNNPAVGRESQKEET